MKAQRTQESFLDIHKCLEKACEMANNTFTWSGKIDPSMAYTKATKEFLNAAIAEYLFLKFRATKKWNVSEERLKCHIMQRVLRKGELWDILPGAKEYLYNNGMRDKDIDDFLFEVIKLKYPRAYDYFEEIFSVSLTQEEQKLFDVAKKLATFIEFETIKGRMTDLDREETEKEISASMATIKLSDYFEEEEIKLFIKMSNAARIVRWAKYRKSIYFTDSAHMLLTAVMAEVITLEYQAMGKVGEDIKPTRAFFKSLLHDIVEVWTGDAPSPCKNEMFFESVNKSLRKVFEEFEEYVYQKHFFKPMDPQLQKEFTEKVVFDEGNDPISQIVKNADYYSADIECYNMIVAGNDDPAYFKVLEESHKRALINKDSGFTNLRVKTPASTEFLSIMYGYSRTKVPAPI